MKRTRSVVLISGSYGEGNVGDEVILERVLQDFKSHQLQVFSVNPHYTQKNFGCQAIAGPFELLIGRMAKDFLLLRIERLKRLIKGLVAVMRCDVFVLGGGGLLVDMNPCVLKNYLNQCLLAWLLKKKVIVYCVGVGPVVAKRSRWLLKSVLNKVDLISVRDKHSFLQLKKLDIKKVIELAPDPAFSVSKVASLAHQPKVVAFNFYRAFYHEHLWRGQKNKYYQLIDTIGEVTRYLIDKKGHRVKYLPFGTRDDQEFAQELYLKNRCDQLSISQSTNDYRDVLAEFGDVDYSITMRFHAGLLSFVNSIPSICIDQQFKSERLLQDMQLLDLLVAFPDGIHRGGASAMNFLEIVRKIEFVEKNAAILKEKIEAYCLEKRNDYRVFSAKVQSQLMG